MCTNVFSNPCGEVVENYHLVLREEKTPPHLGIICERCGLQKLAPKICSYIWTTNGTASQQKILHHWSTMILIVTLVHMVEETTQRQ